MSTVSRATVRAMLRDLMAGAAAAQLAEAYAAEETDADLDAVIAPGAHVGEETFVGAFAYVGDGARIGAEAYVGNNAIIGGAAMVRAFAAVGAGTFVKAARLVTAAEADEIRAHDIEEEIDPEAMPTPLRAYVPVVFQLDLKILTAIELLQERGVSSVGAGSWRVCAVARDRARWAIGLAGAEGMALEATVGTATAAGLIYRASTGRVPNFYATCEESLADIKRSAWKQQWPWLQAS